MKTWICPGSFDPVTSGHLDIIQRAAKRCDKLIVAIGVNDKKVPSFSTEERREMLEKVTNDIDNVEVDVFSGLLVDYAKKTGAAAIVKGLRAVSDFEYELMLALMNRKLNPNFETVFLMPSGRYIYLHSTMVREIADLGGDVSAMVPPPVLNALKNKG